jgi:hypothetical protein
MRTCVLLSGKSNNIHSHTYKIVDYKHYYDNIYKTIIYPFDSDVFISTWDFDDGIDELVDYYNPKLIRVENYNFFSKRQDIISNIIDEIPENIKFLKNNQYPMFYKIYDCNELKKEYELLNDFKYDLVIRCRFDLEFGWEPPNGWLDSFIKEMDNGEIEDAINNDILYLRKDFFRKVCDRTGDHFAFSNSKIMDIYSSIYLNIHKILNSKLPQTNMAEEKLYYHLRNNNIKTKFIFNI